MTHFQLWPILYQYRFEKHSPVAWNWLQTAWSVIMLSQQFVFLWWADFRQRRTFEYAISGYWNHFIIWYILLVIFQLNVTFFAIFYNSIKPGTITNSETKILYIRLYNAQLLEYDLISCISLYFLVNSGIIKAS